MTGPFATVGDVFDTVPDTPGERLNSSKCTGSVPDELNKLIC